MNKLELTSALSKKNGLKKFEAKAIVDIFCNLMAEALCRGESVEIRGFSTFYIKKYRPYTGRNPKTGEIVEVDPKKLPVFKPGKELKERVDY